MNHSTASLTRAGPGAEPSPPSRRPGFRMAVGLTGLSLLFTWALTVVSIELPAPRARAAERCSTGGRA